jgi:hypothetical protein
MAALIFWWRVFAALCHFQGIPLFSPVLKTEIKNSEKQGRTDFGQKKYRHQGQGRQYFFSNIFAVLSEI